MSNIQNNVEKFFLFDRDSSLIDKNQNLINPATITWLLDAIISNPKTPWGIVSTGAIDVAHDSAIKALSSQGIDYSMNTPVYPIIGKNNHNTLDRLQAGQDLLTLAPIKNCVFHDEHTKDTQTNRQKLLKTALSDGNYDPALKTLTYVNEKYATITATIKEGARLRIDLGGSVVVLNLHKWLQARTLHKEGNNKLMQSLLGLNEKHITVVVSEKLHDLGIEEIVTPADYQTLKAQDIVMLDDSRGVFNLMSAAGLNAIRADNFETNYARFNEDKPQKLNQYLTHLAKALNPKNALIGLNNRTTQALANDEYKTHAYELKKVQLASGQWKKIDGRLYSIVHDLNEVQKDNLAPEEALKRIQVRIKSYLDSEHSVSGFFRGKTNNYAFYQSLDTLCTTLSKALAPVNELELTN